MTAFSPELLFHSILMIESDNFPSSIEIFNNQNILGLIDLILFGQNLKITFFFF